jgi:hypothetical protein
LIAICKIYERNKKAEKEKEKEENKNKTGPQGTLSAQHCKQPTARPAKIPKRYPFSSLPLTDPGTHLSADPVIFHLALTTPVTVTTVQHFLPLFNPDLFPTVSSPRHAYKRPHLSSLISLCSFAKSSTSHRGIPRRSLQLPPPLVVDCNAAK